MRSELFDAISQIEKNKGIPEEVLFESIEAALITAYKKNFGAGKNVKIDLDKENGHIKIFEVQVVVEEVTNTSTEISLEKAKEINSIYEIGDTVENEVAPKNFGRIAALAAKQVIVQRIREFEVMKGNGAKRPVGKEITNRVKNRKSIVTIKPIRKGEKFS